MVRERCRLIRVIPETLNLTETLPAYPITLAVIVRATLASSVPLHPPTPTTTGTMEALLQTENPQPNLPTLITWLEELVQRKIRSLHMKVNRVPVPPGIPPLVENMRLLVSHLHSYLTRLSSL